MQAWGGSTDRGGGAWDGWARRGSKWRGWTRRWARGGSEWGRGVVSEGGGGDWLGLGLLKPLRVLKALQAQPVYPVFEDEKSNAKICKAKNRI